MNKRHRERSKLTALIIAAQLIACLGVLIYIGPIVQDQSYHAFADRRIIFGIPNFWNVISNLPFAFVGAFGFARSRDLASRLVFSGVFLTAFGSGYYHWSPNDAMLVWDRLPMTIVFTALLAVIAGERFQAIQRWLIPLVAIGVASVIWWKFSGDLRFYALVQFAPMVIIPTLLLLMPRESSNFMWWVILFYGLAKIAESADAQIYSILPLSGHTLKHLLAATATFFIQRRRTTLNN